MNQNHVTRFPARILLSGIMLVWLLSSFIHAQTHTVTLENDYFKYLIGGNGKNLGFIDKQTGTDYYDHAKETYFARIKIGDKDYNASSIKNPAITVDGKKIVLPVEMKSGDYLEFNSKADCKLYGPKGELFAEIRPIGDVPILKNGINNAAFSCEGKTNPSIRAYVTMISQDEPL